MTSQERPRTAFQREGFNRSIGLLLGVVLCLIAGYLASANLLLSRFAPLLVAAAMVLATLVGLRASLSRLWTREVHGPAGIAVRTADVTGKLVLIIVNLPFWPFAQRRVANMNREYTANAPVSDTVWNIIEKGVRDQRNM